jgi:hypothetical protein
VTYSPEKIAAYELLEQAVIALRAAYKDDGDKDVLTGYVLLTSAVEFSEPSDDPADDDLDTISVGGWYSRRGQAPVLSYGIVHEAIRRYNEVTIRHHKEDG